MIGTTCEQLPISFSVSGSPRWFNRAMKTRRVLRFHKTVQIVAPGRPSRLMPGPDDVPHYTTITLNPQKPILGCHPRLLTKLLS